MTIYALSTPPGVSGIAIIRLSGSNSLKITKEVFSFDEIEFVSLEDYLQEYFETILKRLKEVNYDPEKRRDLTF